MADELIDLPPLEAAIWKYLERALLFGAAREAARKGYPFIIPSSEAHISSALEEIYSILGN